MNLTKEELFSLQTFLAGKTAERLLGHSICGKFDAEEIYNLSQIEKKVRVKLEEAKKYRAQQHPHYTQGDANADWLIEILERFLMK